MPKQNISETPNFMMPEMGIIDLPICMYIEIVSKYERAITICAKIESEHSSDDEKSRVDRLWECVEMQLEGVSLNPKSEKAILYCVSNNAFELSLKEVSQLIDRIKDRLSVEDVLWGCYNGSETAICLTIDTKIRPLQVHNITDTKPCKAGEERGGFEYRDVARG